MRVAWILPHVATAAEKLRSPILLVARLDSGPRLANAFPIATTTPATKTLSWLCSCARHTRGMRQRGREATSAGPAWRIRRHKGQAKGTRAALTAPACRWWRAAPFQPSNLTLNLRLLVGWLWELAVVMFCRLSLSIGVTRTLNCHTDNSVCLPRSMFWPWHGSLLGLKK